MHVSKEFSPLLPDHNPGRCLRSVSRYFSIFGNWHKLFVGNADFNRTFVAVSEPRAKPSALLPFRRDPDFVDRPVMRQILQQACEPGARLGLVGLGGVG